MTPEEIRKRKKELGYTIKQLSNLSGVSVGTLQKILNGETKSPRYETLQALEQALLPPGQEKRTYEPASASLVKEASPAYAAYKKQGTYTVSDYYALPDDQRVELIDGVFYDMGAPSWVHQDILAYVHETVSRYIRDHNGSCIPRFAPVDVRLNEDDKTMVQPDFLIICDPEKIRRWGIMGAPDFMMEIVSKWSVSRDYITKLARYMDAGVKEFWIVDPFEKRLLIYYADPEKSPYISGLSGKKGIGIYNEELVIDLDEIAKLIVEYPE